MLVNDTVVWELSETTRLMTWHSKAKSGAAEALRAIETQRQADEAVEAKRLAVELAARPYEPAATDAIGIVKQVLTHRGVTHNQLKKGGRLPDIVRARREIAYWLRMRTLLSWSQIAARVGLKNTTSVLYLVNKHSVLHGLPVPPTGNRLDAKFDPSIAELAPSIVRKIMGTAKPTGAAK